MSRPKACEGASKCVYHVLLIQIFNACKALMDDHMIIVEVPRVQL